MQIAKEKLATASIRGLHTSRIRERFTWSIEHDKRDPREEEVWQVFMLF